MIFTIAILVFGMVFLTMGITKIHKCGDGATCGQIVSIAMDFFVAGWDLCLGLMRVLEDKI